ncbi:reverse transcriptase, putative [Blumeria hordei DH14]|uniref:Reverse transcriptase, putative n=1 Tax=Blumeria graminis f. sp. hordei (strain DH14) TaxID=546991 RepID=N1JD30_BLUG1|nr:reverse transcriptase, putative [Blumeria hordei DH14]
MKSRRHRSIGPLRLLQINVCRGPSSHELALTFANEERFDIVLIQESYIYTDRQRQITKFNFNYECFTPTDDWSSRPRVLTYIRKGAGLQAVRALLSLTFPGHSNRIFLAGDLNLRHTRWQVSSQTTSPLAEPFIEWTNRLNITLISESDMPTHTRGSVLDLAFASSPLILGVVESSIIPEPDVTSDHLPIASLIPLTLQISSLKASARRALGKGTGQSWWKNDCRNAAQAYRTTRRSSTDQNTINAGKQLLRAAVRGAKRKFFQDKIDQANTAKNVFGMVNWHRTIGSFRTPPLKDPTNPGGPPANTLQEKRDVLARNLLQNVSEVADVALDVLSVDTASLTLPDLMPAEIKDSVIKAGNTAPGEDEIPTAILKIGWPLMETPVSSLFRGCLRAGHHPACFKTVVLVMLNKPNETDRSSPRSYRPIALLSTLGKGLEQLIARRLPWIAIRAKIVASQQFGAVPLRSATDLTTCLVHDIETALNSKLTASLLTLDVKGAFDGVLPVASFTSNHVAKIHLDGSTGPKFDIYCGLPHGPPVSPILSMLYLAPLLHMGTPKRRFEYADDIAFLHTSQSLQENAENLSRNFQEAIQWGLEQGFKFDADKYELQHFSRRRCDQQPGNTPMVRAGPITVSENTARPYTRWLGVLFDKKLSFKWHARTLASKALKVSHALLSLGNTTRGAPPHLPRHAVDACVLPIAYYASETWWPGRSRQGPIVRISNCVDSLLQQLSKVVLTSACATLPEYCITPTAILHRESGLQQPEIALNSRVLTATRPTSRFARRVLAEKPHTPGWLDRTVALRVKTNKSSLISSRISPFGDIIIYSDGSKQLNGLGGADFIGYQVFDTEVKVKGGLEEAKSALALPTAKFATDLWICLDNLEAATRLLSHFSWSSQAQVDDHTSIIGNEAADKAAKDGCHLPTSDDIFFSYAGLKRWVNESTTQATGKLWRTLLPQHISYEKLGIISAPSRLKELTLSRATLGRILAARSGHGDFANYHERFNHENAPKYCRCDRPPSTMIPNILGTHEGGAKIRGMATRNSILYRDMPIKHRGYSRDA